MRAGFLMLLAIVAVMLVSGCTAVNNSNGAPDATRKCQDKCIQLVSTNTDFSVGPCIDDNITADWVCDMAHEPRQPVDEEPANQCSSFGTTAHHFVEVNENCRVIRIV
jgi:CDP-diacylglycerol pyrophosphatase